MTPAFIISYNRLTCLAALCVELIKRDCEPVIIDTGSTYEPLLEWLHSLPENVHFVGKEHGHKAPWTAGIVEQYAGEFYIVTDPDLDISGVPLDMVDHLKVGLCKSPYLNKVGLSLEINDLPKNSYTDEAIEWEGKFWLSSKKDGYYFSQIDTTLALYRKDSVGPGHPNFFTALRADRPYTARHLPWYNVPPLNAEEQYLHDHTTHHGYWKTKFKQHFGV